MSNETENATSGEGPELKETPCTPWYVTTYGSGTTTVSKSESVANPCYHIGHLAADNDGEHGRHDVALELKDWLNGGEEPWWIDLVQRERGDAVKLPHGCEICAWGPFVDRAKPPLWGDWETDQSDDAKIARGLLIDAIAKKVRP